MPRTIQPERQCHGPVEKVAIMADDQNRTAIVGDNLLQQIKRFQIEIIGRLIQHQQIGLTRKFAGKQDARLLAAG